MIELRDAQFSDHAAISKLHAESWQQNYRGIFSDAFLDNEVEQFLFDGWHKKLGVQNSNQHVTIAILDKNIVGFACLLLDDDSVFGSLLDNLHVSIKMRNTGVGKLLMKNCAKIICDKGGSNKMYLWVFALNKNARLVYEHLGGTRFETTETENADGTTAQACRYIWDNVSIIS
jgi:hypothetical protein